MKILTFNAQTGVGTVNGWLDFILSQPKYSIPHSHKKLEAFGKMLADENIDIATLTEVEGESFRSGWRDQVEAIRKNSNLKYKRFFPANRGPFNIVNQGNGIISRYPIKSYQRYSLPAGIEQRIIAQTTLDVNGKEVDVYVTHLSLGSKSRGEQLRRIAQILSNSVKPYILTGDFNTENPQEVERIIDHLQHLPNLKHYNTYPSWSPSKPLDLIFLSKEFRLKQAYVIKNPRFSDHIPLVYEFDLK